MIEEKEKIYQKKEKCNGCYACYNICPVQAISMTLDEERFLYPVIETTKCIHCLRCKNVCPMKE